MPHANSAALRKGRRSLIGQYYFLTTATAYRRPVFLHREAGQLVLHALRSAALARCFQTDAAVVMPDHIHFCGALLAGDLATLMRRLKGYTSRMILRQRSDLATPIWQPGYHDHALRSEESYRHRVDYLLANPVRAGLCERVADYPLVYCRWYEELLQR